MIRPSPVLVDAEPRLFQPPEEQRGGDVLIRRPCPLAGLPSPAQQGIPLRHPADGVHGDNGARPATQTRRHRLSAPYGMN